MNKTVELNVYGYGTDYSETDYSETDLGKVKFDLSEIEGDTIDYCHAVVQEQLGVNLNQYKSAVFMDSKLKELRDKYVDGESMADLLAELGGTHTEDCDDEQAVLNLLEATGHSTGWISVEFIGSDDEYTEYCEGFWQR